MDTARKFLPPFFEKLRESGQVDEAVSLGRAAVREAPDAWVPVLTSRLVEGRVWSRVGLSVEGDPFQAWQQLILQMRAGKCVPILGSGLLEPFVGTTREVANRLATAKGYPMAVSGREDLPQVAQFLKAMENDFTTRLQVVTEMAESLRRRWPELPFPAVGGDPARDLPAEIAQAWSHYRNERPFEPHAYLAGLKSIKTYISTNPDDLLERSLRSAGRAPRVIPCRWDEPDDEPLPAGHADPGSLVPTEERPAVYQLFGSLGDPDSLVVTEDDYFRFLTAVTRKQSQKKDVASDADLTDDLLRGTLANSALIFLGFRLTDWDFRALFRLLIDQGGARNRGKYTHIAVQIDPEDGTHRESVKARDYIERLFRELVATRGSGKIAVYWGGVEDFIRDLDRQWKAL
jgi:hypothetical protein